MELSFQNRELVVFDSFALVAETQNAAASQSKRNLTVVKLDVSRNRLQRFLSGHSLSHLVDLNLSHNKLTYVGDLPPSLQRLNLSHNELQTLDGCESAFRLSFLDASHNQIDEYGLDSLPASLTTLHLSSNKLRSVNPLNRITSLLKVCLEDNLLKKLSDLATLGELKYLRHVAVKGNPVTENSTLISALSASITRLTTLDGVTLAQAKANRIYAVNQRRSTAQHQQQLSMLRQKLQKAPLEQEFSEEAVELQRMEARVAELERLAKADNDMLTNLKKRNKALAKQQKMLESVKDTQEWEIQQLCRTSETLQSELELMSEAMQNLDSTFCSYRAEILTGRVPSRKL